MEDKCNMTDGDRLIFLRAVCLYKTGHLTNCSELQPVFPCIVRKYIIVWTTILDLLCISYEREPINSDLGWWFSLMLKYDTFNNGKATMRSGPFHLHKVASNHRFISIFSLISMCSREESADSLEARRLAACEARCGAAAHWLNDYAIDTWMIGRALPTNSCDCFLMRASSPLPTCGTLGHCPVTDHTARHQVPRRAYWTITS